MGHIVTDQGNSTDPEKIPAVKDWPAPTNVKELRQIFCFHRFLTSIWEGLCHPWTHYLGSLLKGPDTHRGKTPRIGNKPIKAVPLKWSEKAIKAFWAIKEKLTSPPVLGYDDYSKHVTYRRQCIGAWNCLISRTGRKIKGIRQSWTETKRENYSAHTMEFLVLKWAVCNKLHDYVYDSHVQVVTDNNPMTCILSKAMLDASGQIWAAALANLASRYLTDVHFNGNANGLPRKHIIYSDS